MRFRILGPLEVLSPEGWAAINAAKWRSLLACLLVRPGQLVPTDALIDELWGDAPPKRANNLVSIYVHRLRKGIRAAELWLTATELRVEADLACGRAAQLVAELHGLVAEHPMRERLWLL